MITSTQFPKTNTINQQRKIAPRISVQKRHAAIMAYDARYQTSKHFKRPNANRIILRHSVDDTKSGKPRIVPSADLPSYLKSLYDVHILTPADERGLFLKMNYAKMRVTELREELQINPTAEELSKIERFITIAENAKNELIRRNMRLVVHLAKKSTTYAVNATFDDLVSDGNIALMRSVELFDVDRGFKFSTYAMTAIKQIFIRNNQSRIQLYNRETLVDGDILHRLKVDPTNQYEESDDQNIVKNAIDMLYRTMSLYLSPREVKILTMRYGLRSEESEKYPDFLTLQQVGDMLGITKERVRQIETRALQKLTNAIPTDPFIL